MTKEFPKLKKVAVVVPYGEKKFTPEKALSFECLEKHLGVHDRFLVVPEDSNFYRPGYEIIRFAPGYFRNRKTYNALLLNKAFYERFREYEYILIHEPDCLVFRDELLYWCSKGYDYIGAPWFKRVPETRMWWSDHDCVGNGGFSLKKVSTFLKLTEHFQAWEVKLFIYQFKAREAFELFQKMMRMPLPSLYAKLRPKVRTFLKNIFLEKKNAPDGPRIKDHIPEDILVFKFARRFFPGFKVAPLSEALAFSWEAEPRTCFEMNHRKLPFGCHAWEKHDRKFLEGFLRETLVTAQSFPDFSVISAAAR